MPVIRCSQEYTAAKVIVAVVDSLDIFTLLGLRCRFTNAKATIIPVNTTQ